MSDASNAQLKLQAQFRELDEAIDIQEQAFSGVTVAKKSPINPQDASLGGKPTDW